MCDCGCDGGVPYFEGKIELVHVCLNPTIDHTFRTALLITNEKHGATLVFEDLFHTDFPEGIPNDVEIIIKEEIY